MVMGDGGDVVVGLWACGVGWCRVFGVVAMGWWWWLGRAHARAQTQIHTHTHTRTHARAHTQPFLPPPANHPHTRSPPPVQLLPLLVCAGSENGRCHPVSPWSQRAVAFHPTAAASAGELDRRHACAYPLAERPRRHRRSHRRRHDACSRHRLHAAGAAHCGRCPRLRPRRPPLRHPPHRRPHPRLRYRFPWQR